MDTHFALAVITKIFRFQNFNQTRAVTYERATSILYCHAEWLLGNGPRDDYYLKHVVTYVHS